MNLLTRLLEEHEQLGNRKTALERFMETSEFDSLFFADRQDLLAQLKAMSEYYTILSRRIDRIKNSHAET